MARISLALLIALGLAGPALAQADCAQQVNEVRAAAAAEAQLTEQERSELDAVLVQAEQQAQAGDEEACVALIQQAMAEFDLSVGIGG